MAAIAGATTLGAVLAPFTGGLSLLPTAFVVLFGNASALAMYGGSEFVLGQKGPNNQIDDKKILKQTNSQKKINNLKFQFLYLQDLFVLRSLEA